MEYSKCILKSLNQCAFTNTAQIFLSYLDYEELQQLLRAVSDLLQSSQLSQLIRGRMVVLLYQRADRTIYYSYFQLLPLAQLKHQRSNALAGSYSKKELNSLLQSYRSLVSKGTQLYGEQFDQIKEAVLQPTLALPPVKRQTIAPNCQTIYQITLAFQKLKYTQEQENSFTSNSKTTQFFQQCLTFHTQVAYCYVNSVIDELQRFVELSYRFMVYRNTVLSLHSLCPFADITKTMKLWTSRMHTLYPLANKTFLKLLGLNPIQNQKLGFFDYEELKQEAYMMDYIEGLVDQSITEDDVAFCHHSRQKFRGPYASLQKQIVQSVRVNRDQIQDTIKSQQIQKTLQNWTNVGLKPSTLIKTVELFNEVVKCADLSRQLCCRDDYFIENCARVNGLSFPDNSRINLQCF